MRPMGCLGFPTSSAAKRGIWIFHLPHHFLHKINYLIVMKRMKKQGAKYVFLLSASHLDLLVFVISKCIASYGLSPEDTSSLLETIIFNPVTLPVTQKTSVWLKLNTFG